MLRGNPAHGAIITNCCVLYRKVQPRGALQLKDRPQSSMERGNDIFSRRNYTFGSWCSQRSLTPKGLWVPYVEFSDSGQAVVNAFYF